MTNGETRGGYEEGDLHSPEGGVDGLEDVTPQQAVDNLRTEPEGGDTTWREKVHKNSLIKRLMLAGATGAISLSGLGIYIGVHSLYNLDNLDMQHLIRESPDFGTDKEVPRYDIKVLREKMAVLMQKYSKAIHTYYQALKMDNPEISEETMDNAKFALFDLLHVAYWVEADSANTLDEVTVAREVTKTIRESGSIVVRPDPFVSPRLIPYPDIIRELRTIRIDNDWYRARDRFLEQQLGAMEDGIKKRDFGWFRDGGDIELLSQPAQLLEKLRELGERVEKGR